MTRRKWLDNGHFQGIYVRQPARVRETDDPLGRVTFSAGIATSTTDPKQALLKADQALYEAKNNGRDQTIHREPD